MLRAELHNLSVHFGSYQALQGVSLEIPVGQYWVVLGENGAGKSSLLRCLALWMRPSAGLITIDGYDALLHERQLRSRIKFVPDTPTFYAELTAWEHAQMIAAMHRIANWSSRAMDLFHAFSLDQHTKVYPASYSRGMQYKLALLLSLLANPSLLLLDEPFGPLDPAAQDQLAQRLRQLCDEGMSVVVTTHVLPETVNPDHLVFLNQGQLILDWPWEQVMHQYPGNLSTLPYRLLSNQPGHPTGGLL